MEENPRKPPKEGCIQHVLLMVSGQKMHLDTWSLTNKTLPFTPEVFMCFSKSLICSLKFGCCGVFSD